MEQMRHKLGLEANVNVGTWNEPLSFQTLFVSLPAALLIHSLLNKLLIITEQTTDLSG